MRTLPGLEAGQSGRCLQEMRILKRPAISTVQICAKCIFHMTCNLNKLGEIIRGMEKSHFLMEKQQFPTVF